MDSYKVTLTFTEPLLGTVTLIPEIYVAWVAKNVPDAATLKEELATLGTEEVLEKGTTGFHRVDGKRFLYDYVLKGFFKDACNMLRRAPDSLSKKLTAYRKVIDGLVFIEPRRIMLNLNGGGITFCERPLRAQTAQGARIALARSEQVPIGTTITFTVNVLGQVKEALLREWLEYGQLRGLGQWRNSGMGRFTAEMTKQ